MLAIETALAADEAQLTEHGRSLALFCSSGIKVAADAKTSYELEGRLYLSSSGWLLMQIPNALGRGAFDALNVPGIELPTSGTTGQYNAHVSVMSPDEVEKCGGPEKISERGHAFAYTTGEVKTVEPKTWDGVSRVWYITVYSPALEKLRKSYGLEPRRKGYDFHATFALRKTKVLQNNDVKKAAGILAPILELAEWEQVPVKVAAYYKEARPIANRIRDIVKKMPTFKRDQPRIWWQPDDRVLNVSLPDGKDAATENRWVNTLQIIPGVQSVHVDYEWVPPDCVEIKCASALNWLGSQWQGANKAIGGPNPLTKTILGGLLAGGTGYGAGLLMESLFPDDYIEKGKLPRTLGLAGAAVPLAAGAWQSHVNSKLDGTNFLQGAVTGDAAPLLKRAAEELRGIPVSETFRKLAAGFGEQNASGGLGVKSIPVDAFNHMVWRDVRQGLSNEQNPYGTKSPWDDNTQGMHTPPAVGGATTGLMAGIQAQTGSSMISPGDIVRGIASAGVGLATANVVGRTLGALAGLTPAAQSKLQQVGIFGGLLTSLTPRLFGR